jgi:transcriptional regulator with XRE-family HTH domain
MQKTVTPLDAHIGALVRSHRRRLGLTQSDLGAALGVTFQQIQKYEKATNRICAGRLQDIANVLRVPVSAFFNTPAESETLGLRQRGVFAEAELTEVASSDEGLALARSFARISNPEVRRRVVKLVAELSKTPLIPDTDAFALEDVDPSRAETSGNDRA